MEAADLNSMTHSLPDLCPGQPTAFEGDLFAAPAICIAPAALSDLSPAAQSEALFRHVRGKVSSERSTCASTCRQLLITVCNNCIPNKVSLRSVQRNTVTSICAEKARHVACSVFWLDAGDLGSWLQDVNSAVQRNTPENLHHHCLRWSPDQRKLTTPVTAETVSRKLCYSQVCWSWQRGERCQHRE